MKRISLPSQEELLRIFRYDEETGFLYKKPSKTNLNEIKVGFLLKTSDPKSYLCIRHKNVSYLQHRIIWRFVTGQDPGQLEIDHVNNIKNDNRWINLRLATHDNNNQNTQIQKNNSSGFKGVAWHEQRQAWRAYVSIGPRGKSKQKHIGLFATAEEAAEARRLYVSELHKEFTNHG